MGKVTRERAARAAEQAEAIRLPRWTAFHRGNPTLDPLRRAIARDHILSVARENGRVVDVETVERMIDGHLDKELWQNSRYTVIIDRNPERPVETWPEMIHLSIRRNDRGQIGPERFRDFQRIKDELVGTEHEAVELYPSGSRLIDTADHYHLWAFASAEDWFPFGYNDGRMVANGDGLGVVRQTEIEV